MIIEAWIPDSRQETEIAGHYQRVTGIPCTVAAVTDTAVLPNPCAICRSEEPDIALLPCESAHRHGALQSERFGGSYVYLCPASLFFWASPIIIDGIMQRVLVAGPVRSLSTEDIIDELQSRQKALPPDFPGRLQQTVWRDVSVIHSLSEVLRMCAGWASGYQVHQMVENRLIEQQQARLSEYIHELKYRRQPGNVGLRLDLEQRLQQAVRSGDRITARQLLNKLLSILWFSSVNSIDQARFLALEIIILLSQAALQGGASEEHTAEAGLRFQREIGRISQREEIARRLSVFLDEYINLAFHTRGSGHGGALRKALHYIHGHYTEKLSLGETASYVGLHPAYFSKIFNEEVGVSFSSYINSLRCDRAKFLLKYTVYPLVSIAGMVGFDDQSYFSRVFRQEIGISPGIYRRKADRYPEDTYEIH